MKPPWTCAGDGTRIAVAASLAPALALAGPVGAGSPCAQPPANCQQPDQLGHGGDGIVAAISDANRTTTGSAFAVQDNLLLDNGGTINTVCWWGLYIHFDDPNDPDDTTSDCSPGGVADLFSITYFDNVVGFPGEPGPVRAGPFDVTATLTKAATGNLVPSSVGDLVEFQFTATHPDVALGAGECVWIQISNDTTGSNPACHWLWSTAPSAAEGGIGDGVSWQNGMEHDYDLAFCVNMPLGDPSGCALAIDPGCTGATNVCNKEPSPDPGCADQECCTLVCTPKGQGGAGLAFCCQNEWSQQCVTAAVDICGPAAGCGVVGSGSCFLPHDDDMTPFCDDVACCTTVCAVDPFCCGQDPVLGGYWDLTCVIEALQLCDCMAGDEPPNDACVNAIPIGLGDTAIDNDCATSGPPSHATCNDGVLTGLGLDIWYTYTADFTGQLLVTTCGQVSYDTQLAVYEGCDCATLSDPPAACNNDGSVCIGGSSELVVDVELGVCYTIRVGSTHIFPTGFGTLTLSTDVPEPCDLGGSIPKGALPEGEPCGQNTNGGCDNLPAPAAFTSVQFGDTIHGTAWADAGARDTDWYELVLDEATEVSLTIESEFPAVFGIAETDPAGSGNCADETGLLDPGAIATPCQETFVTVLLDPGTWWPFVSVNTTSGFACAGSNDYVLTIGGPPCPWDCANNDGAVNVSDLLALLAEWDVTNPPCDGGGVCDFDGNGCVEVADLLKLLAHYDPAGIGCPQ